MRIILALAACLVAPSAWAACPPTQSAYQFSLAAPYGAPGFVPVLTFFDETNTGTFPGGAPRAVSFGCPLPVTIVGGGGSSGPADAAVNGVPGTGINQPSGGTYLQGWLSGIYSKLSGTLPVTQADIRQSAVPLAASTANAAVIVPLANGEGTVGVTVSGLTASGATLTVEGSNDGGTTWSTINTVAPGTGALSTTVSADGQFRVNAGGHTAVRLRVSATGTGSISVSTNASSVASLVALSAPLPSGSLPTTQLPTAVARTPGLTTATSTGIIASGATSITFANSGSVAATVAGGSLPAGVSVTFNARSPDTLGAVSYTATGTTLLISTVN